MPEAILMTIDAAIFSTAAVKDIGFNDTLTMEEDADVILRFLLKYPQVPGGSRSEVLLF